MRSINERARRLQSTSECEPRAIDDELSHRHSSHNGNAQLAARSVSMMAASIFQRNEGERHRREPSLAPRHREYIADAMAPATSSRLAQAHVARGSGLVWVFAVVLLSLIAQPASAANINFQNCLPISYTSFTPTPLQWVPLFVDAAFDTQHPTHNLRVTMWGNVAGATFNVSLPPPDSPDWQNPNITNGKILADPDPNAESPKLTTLHSKVDVLTYEPWFENAGFCNTSLTNGTCPLAPVFNLSAIPIPFGLPSVTISHDFDSSYAFTSFSATFIIIYGDQAGTNIGCVSAIITPDLGNLAWMLKFLPLVVLLFVGFASVFAGIFSPWGTTDIFHWSSNYGRDADLLRLVTPGFGDCLQYIQFVALTGGLSLNYPGFYQPIVSQASWSALMFNESFVTKSPPWQSIVDGIYVTNGTYGLQELAQLVGMSEVGDIWAGMIVWLLVIIASMFVLVQGAFGIQYAYRWFKKEPEEDLRAKNIPFTLGNVIRIVFNYFLLPIVALSTFQLVVAGQSFPSTVAMAALTLILIIGFAGWLFYLIATTKPRAVLFDDLPTVLLYGPLYNTYSDGAAAFALIPVMLTFIRGIAIGAVQPSGVTQLVLLAICEVIQILTLHGFRPFHSPTSMNAYHTLFSGLRLTSILLMVAFVPSLGVTEGPQGWIGYAVLVIHAGVLVLGFLLNALQTIVEVIARMLGAGGDDVRGQTRGGLSKIFGARQLSRRTSRRKGPSRASHLSSTGMLDEEASKSGYIMPSGRIRSESAGSMGVLLNQRRQTSSSALDNLSLDPSVPAGGAAGTFTPTTPGEASTFSFLPSPGGLTRQPTGSLPLEAADPYYRQPRKRRTIVDMASPADKTRASWTSGGWSQRRTSEQAGEPSELDTQTSQADPAPAQGQGQGGEPPINLAPRADYSTREVDFYYGVRGERLNSDAPSRKLGTGPADPTSAIASAAGWFRNMIGGKTKEKGKGFEVVRSSRMPPAMRAAGGDFDEENAPPEGIPVAMGVLRNGPIESDDDDEMKQKQGGRSQPNAPTAETDLLNADGMPQEDDTDEMEAPRVSDAPPVLPALQTGGSIRLPSRIQSKASSRHVAARSETGARASQPGPHIPRKSSRRHSATLARESVNRSSLLAPPMEPPRRHSQDQVKSKPPLTRLPFERTPSQKRASSGSSMEPLEDFSQIELRGGPAMADDERPTSVGYVHRGSVSHVDAGSRGRNEGVSAEIVAPR